MFSSALQGRLLLFIVLELKKCDIYFMQLKKKSMKTYFPKKFPILWFKKMKKK
jgi:hypothetical protein